KRDAAGGGQAGAGPGARVRADGVRDRAERAGRRGGGRIARLAGGGRRGRQRPHAYSVLWQGRRRSARNSHLAGGEAVQSPGGSPRGRQAGRRLHEADDRSRAMIENPVFVKELRTQMRGARAFVIVVVYDFILLAVLTLSALAMLSTSRGWAVQTELGRNLFL